MSRTSHARYLLLREISDLGGSHIRFGPTGYRVAFAT